MIANLIATLIVQILVTLIAVKLFTLVATLITTLVATLIKHIVDGLDNIQTFVKFKKFNFCTDLLPINQARESGKMFGLGKPRSRFGKFLDKNNLSQQDIVKESGVNRGTISRICQGDAFQPSLKNGNKIIRALKKLTGKNVDYNDFWM